MISRTRVVVAAVVASFAVGCAGPAGPDGKPCTVKDNGDNTATVTCPDGTTVTITNGQNGTNGTNGTNGQNGTNGMNGTNGTSCTVADNPDAGTKTISCTDGTSVTLTNGTNGTNGVDANNIVDFGGLTRFELSQEDFKITVQSVSNTPRPVARFTVRNAKGQAVKNIPFSHFAGISLLQLVPGTASPMMTGNGVGLDVWVSHISNCSTCTSSSESASMTSLVDNGDGTYAYTFAKDVVTPTALADGGTAVAGVAFDANAVHRFALRFADPSSDIVGNRANVFRPLDVTYDYIPATGANVSGQNDKVNGATCLTCHTTFRAGPLNAGGLIPFHGGQRYDVTYCVVCHNSQRKYAGSNPGGNAVIPEPTIDANNNLTPPPGRSSVSVLRGEAIIDLPIFIHKIHAGEHLALKGNYAGMGTELNEFVFPQDVRNCDKCHTNAAKADNWKTRPNRKTCGACHDHVNFETGQGHGQINLAMPNDNVCTVCHDPAYIESRHRPISPPDPNNALAVAGGSNNTHASYLASPQKPPPGARVFKYDLASVTTTDGGPTGVFPVLKFRFTEGDAGVPFNVSNGTNELIDGFVGSPSLYCAYAVPQDGIAEPADFNVSMSAYLKNVWRSGTGGTLAGPDTQGYYTATLTGSRVPASARMLTCGLGYSYSLSSTPPLVQTNVTGFAYDAGTRTGGVAIPMQNAWRVATGFTGRRGATSSASNTGNIVATSRCADCHNNVGVEPSYHAGQRNDGPSCSWCHTQNRTSSAWTAGSESFIHAIHAAKKRTVPFNWHAVAATEDHPQVRGFFGVHYPARLNNCESCHNPGTYDFSGPWYTPENMQKRLQQTVATGTYNTLPLPDGGIPSLAISISPYVNADGTVNYGSGFSYNAGTQATTEAAPTTLVISPIANTCFGCHDSQLATLHMRLNGATIYGTRTEAAATLEQCILCHGPGRTADIKVVHTR